MAGEEETIGIHLAEIIHLAEMLLARAAVNVAQRIIGLENVRTLHSKVIRPVSSAAR